MMEAIEEHNVVKEYCLLDQFRGLLNPKVGTNNASSNLLLLPGWDPP